MFKINIPLKPYLPPTPPPIEEFRTSKERVIRITQDARRKLFEKEKGRTYYAIEVAAKRGHYRLSHKFPENCNNEDIDELQKELIEKGFKVERRFGLNSDTLEISWYPEE